MKKVVVDADQMIYACGFATNDDPVSHALQLVKTKLSEIQTKCDADTMDVYIAGDGNFRDDVAITKTYKGTRKADKPVHYEAIRKYLREKWGARSVDGIETDDVVSMILYEDFCEHNGDPYVCEVVCASPDKDLKNTPGWHYNYQKDTLFWVTEQQAARHFAFQMLSGDRVDHIPGLPYCTPSIIEEFGLSKAAERGCGDGTAKKIIQSIPFDTNPLFTVYRCYASWALATGMESYLTEYITEQGQLLHMLRTRDPFGGPEHWKPAPDLVADALAYQAEEEQNGNGSSSSVGRSSSSGDHVPEQESGTTHDTSSPSGTPERD